MPISSSFTLPSRRPRKTVGYVWFDFTFSRANLMHHLKWEIQISHRTRKNQVTLIAISRPCWIISSSNSCYLHAHSELNTSILLFVACCKFHSCIPKRGLGTSPFLSRSKLNASIPKRRFRTCSLLSGSKIDSSVYEGWFRARTFCDSACERLDMERFGVLLKNRPALPQHRMQR